MTDPEHKISLEKIVFDDNNQQKKSWSCLGQTCSRSLLVLLSLLFVILLIIFGCFWRIHLSKTCDEATVWVGILCSAAGYILLSPRLLTIFIYKKSSTYFIGWPVRNKKIAADLQLAKNWNNSTEV